MDKYKTCNARFESPSCPITVDVWYDQTVVNGCEATVNGSVGTEPGCPQVERLRWQWSDGSENDSWFPASHTYSEPPVQWTHGYSVIVTAYTPVGHYKTVTGPVYILPNECPPP